MKGPRKARAFRGPLPLSAVGLLACLLALAVSAVAALTPGAAGARPVGASSATRSAAAKPAAACVVHSLPSFVAQGENLTGGDSDSAGNTEATVADVIEVECDPTTYGTGSKIKITANQLYTRCQGRLTWYVPNPFTELAGEPGVSLRLDADGNATVALRAGPECAAGESLITAHMEEEPFESFTTSFSVLPPNTTPPGVFALPATEVEGGSSSGVATIIEAEFPGGSEKYVHIASEELFHRCQVAPHLRWIRMDGTTEVGVSEIEGVQLDNDGNGFVIAIGDASCAEGPSLIEADLLSKPFTTFTTGFTIDPPQPTGEASFTIEKSQRIAGGAGGFETSQVTGAIGQTVEYEIVVRNTANVAETFDGFTDTHCDAGTIAGGPGSSPVAAGQSTTYTCSHVLTSIGTYSNEASVTGTAQGEPPLTHTSNQVVAEVPPPPAFTVEKRQEIAGAGGFTTSVLTGAIGETVDYEIVVTNTGGQALSFSNFSDPHCDAGTIAGGPGEAPVEPGGSTTYTCSHVLTSTGSYVNEAAVTGTEQGQPPLTQPSNHVEVNVSSPEPVPQTIPGAPSGSTVPTAKTEVLGEKCAAPPALHGASGSKRGTFTVQTSSDGIKQITFYLDGHKLKTLKSSQAKSGKFSIKINPSKLSHGAHKVSIKALSSDSGCPPTSRSSVFVHPFTQRVAPKFTG